MKKAALSIDQIQEVLEKRANAMIGEAEEKFWEMVVAKFPESKSGDLDPMTSVRLTEMMRSAVHQWVWYNIALSDEVEEIRDENP